MYHRRRVSDHGLSRKDRVEWGGTYRAEVKGFSDIGVENDPKNRLVFDRKRIVVQVQCVTYDVRSHRTNDLGFISLRWTTTIYKD